MSIPGLLAKKAYADGDRQRREEIADSRRISALARLIEDGARLTEWEEGFIAAVLFRATTRAKHAPVVLSERERAKCDQIIESGARMMSAPAPRPAAEPGGCEYLVRAEDGRRVACNAKATWRTPRGMRLCDTHHEERERARRPRHFDPTSLRAADAQHGRTFKPSPSEAIKPSSRSSQERLDASASPPPPRV